MTKIFQKSRVNIYSNIVLSILFSSYLFTGNLYSMSARNSVNLNSAKIVDIETEAVSPKGISSSNLSKVTYVNNTTKKYVPASYDKITGENVVNYAKLYLGLRYVNAGNSLSTGTDCSGFTKLIYKEFGYNLSRGVKSQSKNGSYIRKSDLQPGDLVFYGYGDGIVHHVAIYIGNGKVIHESTRKDGVKISTVNMLEYITSRRIITSKSTKNPTVVETPVSTETNEDTNEGSNSQYANIESTSSDNILNDETVKDSNNIQNDETVTSVVTEIVSE